VFGRSGHDWDDSLHIIISIGASAIAVIKNLIFYNHKKTVNDIQLKNFDIFTFLLYCCRNLTYSTYSKLSYGLSYRTVLHSQ
jgi:hypothetical protein